MSELTAYLCVAATKAAIDWYQKVFGATVGCEPIFMDDGDLGHVELIIGGARLMISDEFAVAGVAAPDPNHGSPVSLLEWRPVSI
ncbi:VOC family protein [Leekyejoonella antrihumi]|uniref:VOC family protein n=1 Tax=Leekyejoonella antrihumi TaxID=1660198 RepID=A0A563E2Y1_9MICO|nr:hypothetical protein [Leekyejoonella antrihumi]TWP36659.1 hypothetical protein FGL98_09390 [Leekyejoonella antrihumi]